MSKLIFGPIHIIIGVLLVRSVNALSIFVMSVQSTHAFCRTTSVSEVRISTKVVHKNVIQGFIMLSFSKCLIQKKDYRHKSDVIWPSIFFYGHILIYLSFIFMEIL